MLASYYNAREYIKTGKTLEHGTLNLEQQTLLIYQMPEFISKFHNKYQNRDKYR